MDARDLVRSVTVGGTRQGVRALRWAWRRRRADAVGLPRQRAERARTPGEAVGAEPCPGGGVVRFTRSVLLVRVTVTGAVFLGWDGAEPEPSYALAGPCPAPDERARLEPDKDGGWRLVSERVLVTVSRYGAVEVSTPGGALLRRDRPPRWWEGTGREGGAGGSSAAAGPRWLQRSELPADARFFGLGGRTDGPRLRDGTYRLWNTAPGPQGAASVTMPVLVSVADPGTLLVFHDNSFDGSVTVREGSEGLGSGHDRPARCEVRMAGGPLRYWVVAGAPSRVLHGWAALTGAPAVPPRWALGHQHAPGGDLDEERLRRVAEGFLAHGLPLRALHLGGAPRAGHRASTVDEARSPGPVRLSARLLGAGVRLVPAVEPAVRAEPGHPVFDSGRAADVFVREVRGRTVLGGAPSGDAVFPDFTDRRVRKWWAAQYGERLEQGFSGVWHTGNEPVSLCAFGDRTLPLSARHALEGRGGDHREAHNVYALAMAKAGYAGLLELRGERRPFVVSRAGWAGMQRYGGAGADAPVAGWAGLRAALSLVLGLGLCGVPYAGPDVAGGAEPPSPELLARALQLGAYLPLFRTGPAAFAQGDGPWECGAEVLEQVRAALAERERLVPYLMTLAQLAHRTGAPYVRPVWWQHPRDRRLRDCEDAFLLGDALLVAPVLEPGVRVRAVRLPAGRWYDTATGRSWDGPATVRLAAPLGRVPVLARAGAAVPVRGADGGTELEVWPPVPGRAGGGLYIPDPGEGWERPEAERFTVRGARGGAVVVEREGGGAVGLPVRVR
ncbi:glycoside hydrolase family 31 protein [Streptomyces albus subsp. chlorinus]|uniref:glycoside hydrolase family 31 protein n=1 Tax=Streptomyces albus TaxID=1888 RepID=UPI00156EA1D8|nr:glycoside hydrolase family 31 protein [Streptomyces albus]NSC20467.1 glycoside hydrolase family 31 protein [Streptomyces albus subsp. chlorinus]